MSILHPSLRKHRFNGIWEARPSITAGGKDIFESAILEFSYAWISRTLIPRESRDEILLSASSSEEGFPSVGN